MPKKSHGLSDTPVHSAWMSMRKRCLNKNSTRWEDWGGRGLTISQKIGGAPCH